MKRMICPCCGYFTVESDDEIIIDICDVCFWQYDFVAHNYPDSQYRREPCFIKSGKSELFAAWCM